MGETGPHAGDHQLIAEALAKLSAEDAEADRLGPDAEAASGGSPGIASAVAQRVPLVAV